MAPSRSCSRAVPSVAAFWVPADTTGIASSGSSLPNPSREPRRPPSGEGAAA